MDDQLTVLDIFCGAGGFSEGFRQQGFDIKLGIDYWRPAVETFNHNFNVNSSVENILAFRRSIKKIEALPDTDVILGSPPCVSFSNSNVSGKADKKSGILLTKLFLKIVAVKKYKKGSKLKAWCMENVVNSRKFLPPIYTFKDLGLAKWAERNGLRSDDVAIVLKGRQVEVNAANYGAAAKRTRLISGEIIERHGANVCLGRFPVPPPTHRSETDDTGNLPLHRTLGGIKGTLPEPTSSKSSLLVSDPQYTGLSLPAHSLSDHFYDTGLYEVEWSECKFLKINHPYMGRMSFPENEQRPSRTVMATRFGISREAMIFPSEYSRGGDGQYRTPTIREAACLMGFPITYQFKGGELTKWKLVGNAVCPFVSFAFAKQVNKELNREARIIPLVQNCAELNQIENLNQYFEKKFTNPPKKRPNCRFRRHPFKDGNMTVTLSNYDIESNSGNLGKWITSVQYGCGKGFPLHGFPDQTYKLIESTILDFPIGPSFISHINNGFLEKTGDSFQLQALLESRELSNSLLSPGKLVDEVARIINALHLDNEIFSQKDLKVFEKKECVPLKQLLALYALSRISAKANGDPDHHACLPPE